MLTIRISGSLSEGKKDDSGIPVSFSLEAPQSWMIGIVFWQKPANRGLSAHTTFVSPRTRM